MYKLEAGSRPPCTRTAIAAADVFEMQDEDPRNLLHLGLRRRPLRPWRQWPRLHLTGMGSSYILMLTAFLVDNGKFLPLWRELPPLALWFIPGVLGLPLLVHALLREPTI